MCVYEGRHTSQADVSASSIRKAQLGEDSEGTCHLLKLPLPLVLLRLRARDVVDPLHFPVFVLRVQCRPAGLDGHGGSLSDCSSGGSRRHYVKRLIDHSRKQIRLIERD